MVFGADFSRCQNNFADVFVLCKLMDEMLGFFFASVHLCNNSEKGKQIETRRRHIHPFQK